MSRHQTAFSFRASRAPCGVLALVRQRALDCEGLGMRWERKGVAVELLSAVAKHVVTFIRIPAAHRLLAFFEGCEPPAQFYNVLTRHTFNYSPFFDQKPEWLGR